jgi:hypothetical protein
VHYTGTRIVQVAGQFLKPLKVRGFVLLTLQSHYPTVLPILYDFLLSLSSSQKIAETWKRKPNCVCFSQPSSQASLAGVQEPVYKAGCHQHYLKPIAQRGQNLSVSLGIICSVGCSSSNRSTGCVESSLYVDPTTRTALKQRRSECVPARGANKRGPRGIGKARKE